MMFVPGIETVIHDTTVPALADLVELEFKFIESGSWDKKDKQKQLKDEVFISIFDAKGEHAVHIDLMGFSNQESEKNKEEFFSGTQNGIKWHRSALTPRGQNFGIGKSSDKNADQLHKILLQIPPSYYSDGWLQWAFTKSSDAPDEYCGVDDIRVVVYGIDCNIPADPAVPGDNGIFYESACGEQVLAVDFSDDDLDDQSWGYIEGTARHDMLIMDKYSNDLEIWHYGFPTLADALVVEFDLYALQVTVDESTDATHLQEGDWSACSSTEGKNCNGHKFTITVGGKKVANLDTFEKGPNDAITEGKKNGIEWTRHFVTENIIHVELLVPHQYFIEDEYNRGGYGKDMQLKLKLNGIKREDIALGMDDLRITTFAANCPGFGLDGTIDDIDTEHRTRGRRKLRTFMQNMERPQSLAEGAYPRELIALDINSDDCTCLCPTGPSAAPSGLFEPRKMKLYADADDECEPKGPEVGTVTMTLTTDSMVNFEYNINQEYEVDGTGVYVGQTRADMKPHDFPYGSDLAATTGNVVADLLDCHYYAAAWVRVCGDFPPEPGTLAPTGSDRSAPTTDRPKTFSPTPAPETPAPSGGSASGDPHIVSWGGQKWDFHGGCDLVLVDNPSFHNGLGMTIHIRTKIVTWWSYIETAVVRIGDETLEVTGGKDHQYLINGVVGDSTAREFFFSSLGLKVLLMQATSKQLKVRIDFLNADAIAFEVFKDFVRVNVKMTDMKWKKFEGSVGLMGSYPHGEFIGRDGKTVFTDMNAFGQEWQVLESEPTLFHAVDGPQHPAQCMMPEEVSTEEKRRRLGESMLTREDAEVACARVGEGSRDACIFDVMATNDLDLAGSY